MEKRLALAAYGVESFKTRRFQFSSRFRTMGVASSGLSAGWGRCRSLLGTSGSPVASKMGYRPAVLHRQPTISRTGLLVYHDYGPIAR